MKRKVKRGEILICPTDKSGKVIITDPDTYLILGQEHTRKDQEITPEEVAETQRKLNGHASMLQKGFGIGDNWGHGDRVRDTIINHSDAVPPMYIMVKDHKEIPKGSWPKTRPVVENCRGMGVHVSNIVSDVVESLANSLEGDFEVISTEDVRARIDEYNTGTSNHLPDRDLRMILGADAVSLFPSLDTKQVSKIVAQEFLKSNLRVEGIDCKELGKYVGMNWSPTQILLAGLRRVVPVRKFKMGPRPGLGSKEAQGDSLKEEEESKWVFGTLEPTEDEERKLIAATLEISIAASFSLHIYTFGGRVFRQTE